MRDAAFLLVDLDNAFGDNIISVFVQS